MSSSINSRFCAYYAHYTGIYAPSQDMHAKTFSKVYMWLVVKEVRAHQSGMAWGMVFGVVVPEVGDSGPPVNL